MWFAGFQMIGRITADGTPTGWRFTVGLPDALTSGPGKAIWYTNNKVPPAISRISATGSITDHRVPSTDPMLEMPGITTGSDGALWFTENSSARGAAHAIGRMTVDGQYTRFPLPTNDPRPRRITAGPDGALWFTQKHGIGRMTVDGRFSEFAVPDGTRPTDIVVGSDGALWFPTDGGAVGRMTTSGEVTVQRIDGARQLIGIAAAPDGSLWIADGGGDTLWHYRPSA
jgi:virginiamycin B lyase